MLRAALIVVLGLAVFSSGVTAPAMAQSQSRSSAVSRKAPDKPARGLNSCAAFGPGFVKVEGSDTCVRIGGSISAGVGGRAR